MRSQPQTSGIQYLTLIVLIYIFCVVFQKLIGCATPGPCGVPTVSWDILSAFIPYALAVVVYIIQYLSNNISYSITDSAIKTGIKFHLLYYFILILTVRILELDDKVTIFFLYSLPFILPIVMIGSYLRTRKISNYQANESVAIGAEQILKGTPDDSNK